MSALNRKILAASWRSWVASDFVRVGPYWLQLVWTALFSMALAVVFTLLGFFVFAGGRQGSPRLDLMLHWYGRNLIVCLTIGYLIHALLELGAWWLGAARLRTLQGWQRSLFFAGIPIAGVVMGWPLGVMFTGVDLSEWFSHSGVHTIIVYSLLFTAAMTWAIHNWFNAKARQYIAEQRATEAQLRLLQGQIEPHFLFNTLANVNSLIDHDPAKAKDMLGAFTDYLRASLGGLRRDEGTLADELALAEAYLRVQQSRMEDRLVFRIEADDAARQALMPPLLLQPLVENAVHHGLEPKIEGGTVQVLAKAVGRQLIIDVRDNGRGLQAPARKGAGMALANIRERLLSRFGDAATLELSTTEPGTLARIVMPLQPLVQQP
jgi:Histidine kinase